MTPAQRDARMAQFTAVTDMIRLFIEFGTHGPTQDKHRATLAYLNANRETLLNDPRHDDTDPMTSRRIFTRAAERFRNAY